MTVARHINWTPEQRREWDNWVATRPRRVADMCRRWPCDRLYQMSTTGQRVIIEGYNEDGTVRVAVTGKYNLVTFERSVFGVDPHTLTECDLPDPDTPCGNFGLDPTDVKTKHQSG